MAGELSKAVMVEFAERFTALEAGEDITPPSLFRGKGCSPTIVQNGEDIVGSVPHV